MSTPKGLARISFNGGVLVMPAQNGYDRELIFEAAEFYARRHGQARLELNRKELLVSATNQHPANACALCAQPTGPLTFAAKQDRYCPRCARKAVGSRQ